MAVAKSRLNGSDVAPVTCEVFLCLEIFYKSPVLKLNRAFCGPCD